MENREVSTGGIGLGGVVFVVLLVLKLTENIAMSWFLVLTSVIWAPLLVVLTFLMIVLGGFVLVGLVAMIGSLFRR